MCVRGCPCPVSLLSVARTETTKETMRDTRGEDEVEEG